MLPETERIERAEHFCAALGIDIRHGGSQAYYSPSTDHVQMPEFACFRDAVAYYAVMLHECGHASGAKHRLDRDLSGRFGSAAYAMEECSVELLSAMICADLNLSPELRLDHARYIASWLEVLRTDKRAIFTAASKAQEIADWMHAQQSDA
ncbi:DNA primase TraC [compost metagenome]